MKIRLFIVTYNNAKELNATLKSIFSCDLSTVRCEVNIINNHSNFSIEEQFKDKVTVLHNVLRPDFSTGYLSRNWNQALILGFENLNQPSADIVVACQDDTYFFPNWLAQLVKLHNTYSFITYGWGDNFMSWTPDGVKTIGLWDERFVFNKNTSDYFLRALLFNKTKTSINDSYHKRLLNPENVNIAKRPHTVKIHNQERATQKDSDKVFLHKWGRMLGWRDWTPQFIVDCTARIQVGQCIMYPYFEKHIDYSKQKVLHWGKL